MERFFKDVDFLAKKALAYEALFSPKPGLVDRFNSGAHNDMDIYTFINSIISLNDYFYKCIKFAFEYEGENYYEILDGLRPLGLQAERNMYKATNNVNTHKGAIFLFGLICGAVGSLKNNNRDINITSISSRVSDISKNILEDFKITNKTKLTYGESQFMKLGNYGARGEVKFGLPSINQAYNIFLDTIKAGYSERIAFGQSLLKLMSIVEDSNIIGRKGLVGIKVIQEASREIMSLEGYKSEEGLNKIREIDELFIKDNISPGGCADLAAGTLFIYWIEKFINSCNQNI